MKKDDRKRSLESDLESPNPKRHCVIPSKDHTPHDEELDLAFDKLTEDELRMLSTPSKHTYSIRSIIHHHGSTAFNGHYTTDVYEPTTRTWKKFDDSVVKTLAEEDVNNLYSRKCGYIYWFVRDE
jgi:uncharacterized UBP type Zn finger protein